MSKSLQDQLLGANLIDSKKAKKISKEKRKTKNVQRRNKDTQLTETQAAALKAKQEKLERDALLNKQKNDEAAQKAIAAQVIQMIKQFRLSQTTGDTEYNFTDGKVIKKLRVSNNISTEIIRGRLCIAKLQDQYEIIPRPVAEKIRERDDSAIIVFNKTPSEQKNYIQDNDAANTDTHTEATSDEEYYAQFEIPDDLDW
jgi:uncharacterized protein YaiL (DUF2058 family)